jgi:transcription antitermination factor NusG
MKQKALSTIQKFEGVEVVSDECFLPMNTTVKILDGDFAGAKGILKRFDKHTKKVTVELKIMDNLQMLEFSEQSIAKDNGEG